MPLSTLRLTPRAVSRKTQGQDGVRSLLSCGALSSPTTCRFIPAHPQVGFELATRSLNVHFTPTYGSWINLVERWFAELTNKRLRRGVFRSVKELEAAIREYIAVHNQDPKPFVWTRTADQILASISRYAQRTAVHPSS